MNKNNFSMLVLCNIVLLSGINFEMRGDDGYSSWSFSGLRSALASMVPVSWGVPDWAMNFVSRLGEHKMKAILGAIIAYFGITPVRRLLRDYEQKQKNDALRRKQQEEGSLYFVGEPLPTKEQLSEEEIAKKIEEREQKEGIKETTEEAQQRKEKIQAYKEKLEREKQERELSKAARQSPKSSSVLGSMQKTYETYGQHRARLAQEKERSKNPLLYAVEQEKEERMRKQKEEEERIREQEEQEKMVRE